ncbi:transglutaminase-like domain-containing protein [Sphingomonas sp. R647]|uniref:transglutaminase-like domain-containing protein n=1 Tax=Sphingomonas sp. R647 TaxID=2875233 RepID=UPI001CD5E7A2|nr:transglutaminase-like domain-containing protein [Sphingomonas sp. R647]MCA1198040.1 transglutaminase-like domain-containing protein [Sphingomonas sp. R647]
MLRRLLFLTVAIAALPGATQREAKPRGWYVIADDAGVVLGHAATTTRTLPDGRETIELRELRLADGDRPSTTLTDTTTTRFDSSGRPLLILTESRDGRTIRRLETRITAASATVTRHSESGRHVTRIALPAGTRFDNGEALMRGWTADSTLSFLNLNPAAALVERVTIERAPTQRPGTLTVLRKRFEGTELRGIMRLDLDASGRIVAAIQPMFGVAVTTRPVDRDTALRPHPPYRLLRNVMAKSPVRIGPAAAQGHIRYRFGFIDGIAFSPPATGEQRVTLDATGVTLDICTSCGPGLPGDPATLADARRATAWLQHDHPRVLALARPVIRRKLSPARTMEELAVRARTVMHRIDFTGHRSAADALASGAGDCTEDAVVLAALGRAAGIPTRVASGLVYSRERYHGVSNVFMPHSWTLAYVDGAWRSFDMSLDGFDATHIALTIGDGDARSITAAGQLASLLDWQSLAEVRTRASP